MKNFSNEPKDNIYKITWEHHNFRIVDFEEATFQYTIDWKFTL